MMIKEPTAPASPAQVSYLESLVKDRDLPAICERYQLLSGIGALTKGQASQFIDQLLTAPKKAVKATVMSQPAPVIPELKTTEPAPAYGYYEDPTTGQLWYFDTTAKDFYPQLRMLVLPSGHGYYAPKKASWKKVYATGQSKKMLATWTPYAGKKHLTEPVTKEITIPGQLVKLVEVGVSAMTMQEAAAKSKACGFCIRCGALLTVEESVAAGLGPVCRKYWGL